MEVIKVQGEVFLQKANMHQNSESESSPYHFKTYSKTRQQPYVQMEEFAMR